MNSYLLVVFLHVASAVLLLATSLVGEPAVRAAVRRASRPQELRAFLEVGRPMALLSPVAALLLLGSGIYLTSVARFWALGWIQVAVVCWVINALLAVTFLRPAIERLTEEATSAADGSIGPRLHELRWSGAWTWGLDAMAANDAAMLYIMSLRPGLGASVAVVVLANAALAAARLALGAHRPLVTSARAMRGP